MTTSSYESFTTKLFCTFILFFFFIFHFFNKKISNICCNFQFSGCFLLTSTAELKVYKQNPSFLNINVPIWNDDDWFYWHVGLEYKCAYISLLSIISTVTCKEYQMWGACCVTCPFWEYILLLLQHYSLTTLNSTLSFSSSDSCHLHFTCFTIFTTVK